MTAKGRRPSGRGYSRQSAATGRRLSGQGDDTERDDDERPRGRTVAPVGGGAVSERRPGCEHISREGTATERPGVQTTISREGASTERPGGRHRAGQRRAVAGTGDAGGCLGGNAGNGRTNQPLFGRKGGGNCVRYEVAACAHEEVESRQAVEQWYHPDAGVAVTLPPPTQSGGGAL